MSDFDPDKFLAEPEEEFSPEEFASDEPKPQNPMGAAKAAWVSMPGEWAGELGGGVQAAMQAMTTPEEERPAAPEWINKLAEYIPVMAMFRAQMIPETKARVQEGYESGKALQEGLLKQAREEQPIASIAGEIGGSMAIPGGSAKGIAAAGKGAYRAGRAADKGIKTAEELLKAKSRAKALAKAKAAQETLKQSALLGGAYGGLMGLGAAEDVAEKPLETAQTVAKGVSVGSAYGAAAPLAVAAVAAPIKGIKNFVKGLDATEDFVKAKTRAARGEKVAGKTGREEATEAGKVVSQELADKVGKFKRQIGKSLDVEADRLTAEGKQLDITDTVLKNLKEIEDIAKFGPNEATRNTAREAYDNIMAELRVLKGYGAKADDPALAKLKDQQAKLRLAQKAKEPQILGKESVKKQAASKIEAAKAKREAILNKTLEDMGENPAAMSYAEKNRMITDRFPDLELPAVPEFAAPKTILNKETGKKVVQMLDEETGQTVQKTVDDFDPTTAIVQVADPVTGKSFYRFRDKATGKTFMRPVTEEPIFEVTSTITPTKAREMADYIKSVTPEMDRTTASVVNSLDDMEKSLTGKLKDMSDPYKNAAASYKALMRVLRDLKIDKKYDIDEITKGIRSKLETYSAETGMADFSKAMFGEFIDELRKLQPQVADAIEKPMMDAAEKLDLAYTKFGLSAVVGPTGSPTIRGQAAGIPVRAGEIVGNLEKRANDLMRGAKNQTPEMFIELADALSSRYGKKAKEFSQALKNIAFKEDSAKKAVMFGLMQRPEFRQMIKSESENEAEAE